MKWFDNMVERAIDRVRSRLANQLPRQGALHSSSLSDILNGRACAMVYSIDNGFILVNADLNRNQTQFVHAKDAVEVGEIVARQLTLQRMGVVQGASIRGASTSGPFNLTAPVGPGQAKVQVNPSF